MEERRHAVSKEIVIVAIFVGAILFASGYGAGRDEDRATDEALGSCMVEDGGRVPVDVEA